MPSRPGVGASGQNVRVSQSLARAIEGLSTPGVDLPDALRWLFVVSRRLRAEDLTTWLRAELDGYPDSRPAPPYRTAEGLPIELHFVGMMHSSDKIRVTGADLPEDIGAALRKQPMRQPVAELAALAAGDSEVGGDLPPGWIHLYRQHIEESGSVPHISTMVLNHARILVPRTYLLGILDRVKSNALDLALDLEQVAADAGDTGGRRSRMTRRWRRSSPSTSRHSTRQARPSCWAGTRPSRPTRAGSPCRRPVLTSTAC